MNLENFLKAWWKAEWLSLENKSATRSCHQTKDLRKLNAWFALALNYYLQLLDKKNSISSWLSSSLMWASALESVEGFREEGQGPIRKLIPVLIQECTDTIRNDDQNECQDMVASEHRNIERGSLAA